MANHVPVLIYALVSNVRLTASAMTAERYAREYGIQYGLHVHAVMVSTCAML